MILAKVKIFHSLLLIALIALVLCACKSPAHDVPTTSDGPSVPANSVEVVYFHRTQRCRSCIYTEGGTRYTVETYFKDELDDGKLSLKVVDVENKKNAAIVKKYSAFTSSLFINVIIDGTDHIEEAKEVYYLIGNDIAFVEELKGKIERSLREIE